METGSAADVTADEPVGVIPAGTLLKTEFTACVPGTGSEEKTTVSWRVGPWEGLILTLALHSLFLHSLVWI